MTTTPFTLPNDTVLTDTPVFKRKGHPAKAPAGATPTWTAGDATLAALTPAADGLSATITPVAGAVGKYTYSFADGPLGYTQEIDIVAPVADEVEPGLSAAS